ncbi:RRM domain protein [Pseudoloma neurophilia]|uniref:RRM domain protein n=1 Tax=Pseudoloma neurophilia TaxID=146866 RepID=A0A0R0M8L4_9MICR|nr:RRM domain protein [Pseudoloma neurophilia]
MEDLVSKRDIRTIKLENIPSDASPTTFIDFIKDCEIENIRETENFIYLTFFEYSTFYLAYFELKNKIKLIDTRIKISFLESPELQRRKLLAFQAGASRSIYFNNIEDGYDETHFKELAEPFGKIEYIRFNKEKKHIQIRFYEFDRAVDFMKNLMARDTQEVKFGFHRAKTTNKAFHSSRTLYLGNIQPEIEAKHILKYCFSGNIYTLRILRERKCAFLTFVNPHAAETFIEYTNRHPIIIGRVRLKITYGNNSLIPMPAVLSIYDNNASRCIEVFSTESIDFENCEKQIKFKDRIKYCFFSMNGALQAIESVKKMEKGLKVSYARDESAAISSSNTLAFLMYESMFGGKN